MTENEIAKIVFDSALAVHKSLGPKIMESAYEECLFYELLQQGIQVSKRKPLPVKHEQLKTVACYVWQSSALCSTLT